MNAWFARVGAVLDSKENLAKQASRVMALMGMSSQSGKRIAVVNDVARRGLFLVRLCVQ